MLWGIQWWLWVERSSWVVTLIAVPAAAVFALWQLHATLNEVRRIRMSLDKKPRFRFYFMNQTVHDLRLSGDMPEKATVELTFGTGAMSKPFHVEVCSKNVGDATAHNVLMNVIIHGPDSIESQDLGAARYVRLNPETSVRRRADGSIQYVRATTFQHVNHYETVHCTLVVPMVAQFVHIDSACAAEEVWTGVTRLTIQLEPV